VKRKQCPKCGSTMTKRRGWGKVTRWVCVSCAYSEEVQEGK
jgi:ribosomal protein S27AE